MIPDALALRADLVRRNTKRAGSAEFTVIKLKTAVAADAARILDEAFKRPAPAQQGGRGGFPRSSAARGVPIRHARRNSAANPTEGRVRVVADPRAIPCCQCQPARHARIRQLLDKAIDATEKDPARPDPDALRQAQIANAEDVADVIRQVYAEQMSQCRPRRGSSLRPRITGNNRQCRFLRQPRAVTLSVGVIPPTTAWSWPAHRALYNDIRNSSKRWKDASKITTTTVKDRGREGR